MTYCIASLAKSTLGQAYESNFRPVVPVLLEYLCGLNYVFFSILISFFFFFQTIHEYDKSFVCAMYDKVFTTAL